MMANIDYTGFPGAQCLLNEQNSKAHAMVFREIFAAGNVQHKDFNNGYGRQHRRIDLLDAEANGLENPLG